jgi:hypothetical protein
LTRKNTKQVVVIQKEPSTKLDLANHELVVLAAFLAGAQATPVDTEDIAVKANTLAPGRFSWRKYKDQINIDTVRKRLWDATKAEKGGYLIGSEKTGWRLTKAGFDFARRQMGEHLIPQSRKARTSQNERVTQTREVRRMINETAFLNHKDGNIENITKSDAERFFRLDDYVTGKARTAKIERFRIMAANNEPLTRAIDFLASLVGGA